MGISDGDISLHHILQRLLVRKMDAINNRFNVIANICHLSDLGMMIGVPEQDISGWTNITLKITTTKAVYILRQYQPHSDDGLPPTFESIQAELDFIKYLHDNGLPVVPAMEPPGICLVDEHPSVFFPFIHGVKHVNHLHAPDRDLWQTVEVARFLGTMHRVAQDYHGSSFSPAPNDVVADPTLECKNEEFRQNCGDLLTRAQRLTNYHPPSNFADIETSLPKGLLHVDLNADNVLFDDEKRATAAVLDFDEVSYGPFIFDVAVTLGHWCSKGSQFSVEYIRAFLHEYGQARQLLLTEDELKLLLVYCALTTLAQIKYFIHSDRDLQERKKMIEETLRPVEAMIELEEMGGFLVVLGKTV